MMRFGFADCRILVSISNFNVNRHCKTNYYITVSQQLKQNVTKINKIITITIATTTQKCPVKSFYIIRFVHLAGKVGIQLMLLNVLKCVKIKILQR